MVEKTEHQKNDIYFIAKEAGVSPSTVSRVLNDKGIVTKEKTERVLRVCKKYDYTPSRIARAIRTKRINTIALIVQTLSELTKNIELIRSVEKEIYRKGYYFILINTECNETKQNEVINLINEKVIEGLILQGSGLVGNFNDDKFIKEIKKRNIPMIYTERFIVDYDVPFIVVDGKYGGKIAARYIINNNHKNIGIVTPSLKYQIYKDRVDGFLNILNDYKIRPKFILELDFTDNFELILDDLNKHLNIVLNGKISAIFTTADIIAVVLADFFKFNNIKIPEDISIIGFDNHVISSLLSPKLTTVDNDLKRVGELAVDLIIDCIEKKKIEKKEIIIKPKIIERGSVRGI